MERDSHSFSDEAAGHSISGKPGRKSQPEATTSDTNPIL